MIEFIEATQYQINANDKQHIELFLEFGKKYNFFATYTEGDEHYRHLNKLDMLAYLVSTFDKSKCVELFTLCMGDKLDMNKFTDEFIALYIKELTKAKTNGTLNGFQQELVDREIANTQAMKSAPSEPFLPDWYTWAKDSLGKNGQWTKPFHAELEQKMQGNTVAATNSAKEELIEDFDNTEINLILKKYPDFFKTQKHTLDLLSKEELSNQIPVLLYLFEAYLSKQDMSRIESYLTAAQNTKNYHPLLVALYQGGMAYAKMYGGPAAEIQEKALLNYISMLNGVGESVSINVIRKPNATILPLEVPGFWKYLESHPNISLSKIVNSIK